ncbi:hypothetical protein GE21DRAFT_1352 [Neurospora crassa]|uniref:Uncharacterized protein n=1 Tax=Neurospora crassa (strain ATCC 24698 / 74-OR23-1A / CBS 708.71 / DSM 1257 / FGSC 987) TaxID=367110 RepID=Q7SDW8_NEUCR|nr:hypothetical protein NCU03287 [Neurospora crassa OR74A]EAA34977.1 hypothetical protein NCU03287 [Neurospora crassa OR74A]KHE78538.1 hypothetical protein GE21DRAFT_1352 [Neurospora crassa]|eukprot:XP_964213.1 hypothetical protein NCU03287 [Neurospora crassa OR74A]
MAQPLVTAVIVTTTLTDRSQALTFLSTLTPAPVVVLEAESNTSFSPTCSPAVSGNSPDGDSQCQTTPAPAEGRDGVASGAAAGIAIGCLIIGIILGIAAAFCFFSRRRQRHRGHGDVTEVAMTPSKDASYAQAGSGMQKQDDNVMPQLKNFLLDSLSDQELAAELRDRHHLIQQHVENHYHFHPLDATRINRQSLAAALSQLGLGQASTEGPSAESIVSFALDPNTRQIALQHVLSTVIFTSIDPSARSPLSMLPPPVAAFLQSIPMDEEHGVRRQVHSQASTLALHWWRVLSAFLLHPQRSQRTALTPTDAALAPQAAAMAQALNSFLRYFVEDSDTARFQQESHLREVIVDCAKFGYLLFSQPSDWCMLHVAGHEQVAGTVRSYREGIVCAAGLVKRTDKDGRRLGGSAQTSGTLVVPPVVG